LALAAGSRCWARSGRSGTAPTCSPPGQACEQRAGAQHCLQGESAPRPGHCH
jgi:hypothetical protein